MSTEQIKLLKKVNDKGEYEYIPAVSPEIPQLHYLRSLKYIRPALSKNGNNAYVITEEGKAKLNEIKENKRKYWVSIVISLSALLIAVCSALMQLLKQ